MKKILLLLLIASCSVVAWAAELTMYAAPAAAGNGDGSSPENAARLWDHKLWWRVKKALEKSPVTLQLAPGNYYTELPSKKETSLVLRGVGNEKHHFTLRGAENHGSVFARHPNDSKEIKNNLFPLIIIRSNSRNIIIEGLRFTGNGLCSAALAVSRSRDILIRNCEFNNPESLFRLDFDGKHIWCCNRSLASIKFENCKVEGVATPIYIHGDQNEPIDFTLENVEISARPGAEDTDVIQALNFSKITLNHVAISGYNRNNVLLKSEGKLEVTNSSHVTIVKEGYLHIENSAPVV
jgi:hypothetical protein